MDCILIPILISVSLTFHIYFITSIVYIIVSFFRQLLPFDSVVHSFGSHLLSWPDSNVNQYTLETSALNFRIVSYLNSQSSFHFTTLNHFLHYLHRLHHCSPLKSIFTPRLKPCNYSVLRFFPGHHSCHYVHIRHNLTLKPYVSSYPSDKNNVHHFSKPSSKSNPLYQSKPTEYIKPTVHVKLTVHIKPTSHIKPIVHIKPTTHMKPIIHIKPTAHITPTVHIKPIFHIKPHLLY